jgi:hypothetical protein
MHSSGFTSIPELRAEENLVSPEGIDHGKARLKAEAVWLILSGEPDSRPKAEKMVSREGIEPRP